MRLLLLLLGWTDVVVVVVFVHRSSPAACSSLLPFNGFCWWDCCTANSNSSSRMAIIRRCRHRPCGRSRRVRPQPVVNRRRTTTTTTSLLVVLSFLQRSHWIAFLFAKTRRRRPVTPLPPRQLQLLRKVWRRHCCFELRTGFICGTRP